MMFCQRLPHLFQHADWVENLAIHPRYETEAAYFARVLSVPTAVALLDRIAMSHFVQVLKCHREALWCHVGTPSMTHLIMFID